MAKRARTKQSAPAAVSSPARASSYALAIFLGSTLLFLLEPIAAKRLVPLLGGSAAVWTTCLVFFQTALLLGYYVAHLLVTRTSLRTQVTAYVGLLALSVVQLVRVVDPTLAGQCRTTDRQRLVVALRPHRPAVRHALGDESAAASVVRAHDAARTGRRIPAICDLEHRFDRRAAGVPVADRTTFDVCALRRSSSPSCSPCWRSSPASSALPFETPTDDAHATTTAESAGVPLTTRVLWVALAACASLLLAATTTHISQNVVALPLVWIVPLVAYLLSFVVAFATRTWPPRWLVVSLAIVGLLGSGFLLYRGVLDIPILPATAAFCVALFFLCLFLHSELYHRRPAPRHLTSFYFHVAAGGALGAVLVGIVAPLVLPGNYDFAIGLLLTAVLGLVVAWPGGRVMRGVWSALLAAGIALIATQVHSDRGAIVRVRNFYGTVRVMHAHEPEKADVRSLYHGVIVHGRQVFRVDLRRVPNTYYARTSGLGLALDQCCGNRPRRIGVIGLGTGTVAVYGNPGDTIRFYEINRAVEDIALSDVHVSQRLTRVHADRPRRRARLARRRAAATV